MTALTFLVLEKSRREWRLPDCENPRVMSALLSAGLSEQTQEAGSVAPVSSEG